jgi:hypothetical protein
MLEIAWRTLPSPLSKGVVPARTRAHHSARVYISRTALAAYVIAPIDVRYLDGTPNPRASCHRPSRGSSGVTKIQNKIVAAAARIGFTSGFKPVLNRKAYCSRICPGRRENILILGQTD